MKGTLEERFWAKVDKKGPDDCWEWTGALGGDRYGHRYGQIGISGKIVRAHRVSWELANGPIPKGICVLHHCDNPSCVNPSHLFLGTKLDNAQDAIKKGRYVNLRGEDNGAAELTEQDVHEIRQMLGRGIPQRVIAKKYGVSKSTVTRIGAGKTWGWLKEE